MVGNYDGIAKAVVDGQVLRGFPRILREALPHMGAEERVGTMADFRVRVEQAQSRVRDGGAGRCLNISRPYEISPVVAEKELAILVVRTSRACLHVDLIVVVLPGALKHATEFQRVVSPNPCEAVRHIVDGTRGMGGVRPAA